MYKARETEEREKKRKKNGYEMRGKKNYQNIPVIIARTIVVCVG
jgi:hypothetical protein